MAGKQKPRADRHALVLPLISVGELSPCPGRLRGMGCAWPQLFKVCVHSSSLHAAPRRVWKLISV